MDRETEHLVRAAIDDQSSFTEDFYYRGKALETGSVITAEDVEGLDWEVIRNEITKYMEQKGVELRSDGGRAKLCKGGNRYNAPSSTTCMVQYKGLYCASKTKNWRFPDERKRSRRSKRSSNQCKACIRFQFNGVSWKVNKIVTEHCGHCPLTPRGMKELSEGDKAELRELIMSDRVPVTSAISSFMRMKGVALTPQDTRNIINGWENRRLSGLEI